MGNLLTGINTLPALQSQWPVLEGTVQTLVLRSAAYQAVYAAQHATVLAAAAQAVAAETGTAAERRRPLDAALNQARIAFTVMQLQQLSRYTPDQMADRILVQQLLTLGGRIANIVGTAAVA